MLALTASNFGLDSESLLSTVASTLKKMLQAGKVFFHMAIKIIKVKTLRKTSPAVIADPDPQSQDLLIKSS